jgi:hypothetical protein
MLKLSDLTGQELKWTQPHALKMEFDLLCGDIPAAWLRFRSSFGTFATGSSADGSWTFKRVGFWQTRVTIRAEGSEAELAAFRNNTWKGGGTLELADGRKFPADTNFWSTQFNFRTEAGEALITYTKIGGFLHTGARMEILPPAVHVPETPWMALLGWYLTVMQMMDSAAVVAATTAAT